MITFKQYLYEAKIAPLYHGTPLAAARNIWSSDKLESNTWHKTTSKNQNAVDFGKYGTKKGISFSRSPHTSYDFARKHGGADTGIIFSFDQQKLNSNYKVIPFNYWNPSSEVARDKGTLGLKSDGNEQEEFLVSPNGIPFSRYMTAFWAINDLTEESMPEYMLKDPRYKGIMQKNFRPKL